MLIEVHTIDIDSNVGGHVAQTVRNRAIVDSSLRCGYLIEEYLTVQSPSNDVGVIYSRPLPLEERGTRHPTRRREGTVESDIISSHNGSRGESQGKNNWNLMVHDYYVTANIGEHYILRVNVVVVGVLGSVLELVTTLIE